MWDSFAGVALVPHGPAHVGRWGEAGGEMHTRQLESLGGNGYAWLMDEPTDPPWLHLLTPLQAGWREKQILNGRDPDPYIEQQLKEAGIWPVANDAADGG